MTTPDTKPDRQGQVENLLWNVVLRLPRLSVAYGVGRVSTKALSGLLVPIYIRYLTPADLGIVATAPLTTGVADLVSKPLQNASVLRFYYDYRDAREDLGRFLGGVMCLVLAASLAVLVFLLLAGGSIAPRVLPEILFHLYLLYALLTALLTPLSMVAITLYRVREQAGRYTAATWLTYGGYAALIWWGSRRLYPLPLEYGRIGRFLILTVGCLALTSALGAEPGPSSPPHGTSGVIVRAKTVSLREPPGRGRP